MAADAERRAGRQAEEPAPVRDLMRRLFRLAGIDEERAPDRKRQSLFAVTCQPVEVGDRFQRTRHHPGPRRQLRI
jgi:hypothetical protein